MTTSAPRGTSSSKNPLRHTASTPSQSLPGQLTMTLGRALDPLFNYALLRHGVAGKILQTIGFKGIITLPLVTRVGLNRDFFGTGLVDKPGNMLLTLGAITSLRHLYWANIQNTSIFPTSMGLFVSTYNSFFTLLNSLVFVYRVSRGKTNPLASDWMQYLGFGLVLVGNVGEIVAERGRREFKSAGKKNEGKVYKEGAFGVVRNPNYSFYLLHRIGAALATGSLLNTAFTFLAQSFIFIKNSIPELSGHMSEKYGDEWTAYTKKVPYALIPYVY